jgi:thiamine-phosphate pyrophosphorylase
VTITNAAVKLNSAWRRRRPGARRLPVLFLMTDPHRLPDPLPYLHRLPRGAGVIFRCYDGKTGAASRRVQARRLRKACQVRGLCLLIAGDDHLAAEARADGIHLGEWRLGRGAWKRGPARARRGLVTASCHGRAALYRAAAAGVDAALLAPVFPTESHPDARALGHLRFATLVRQSRLPVFALGGVGPGNIGRLKPSGAAGIAGIGAIIDVGEKPKKT